MKVHDEGKKFHGGEILPFAGLLPELVQDCQPVSGVFCIR
jgi:hypothetical protein